MALASFYLWKRSIGSRSRRVPLPIGVTTVLIATSCPIGTRADESSVLLRVVEDEVTLKNGVVAVQTRAGPPYWSCEPVGIAPGVPPLRPSQIGVCRPRLRQRLILGNAEGDNGVVDLGVWRPPTRVSGLAVGLGADTGGVWFGWSRLVVAHGVSFRAHVSCVDSTGTRPDVVVPTDPAREVHDRPMPARTGTQQTIDESQGVGPGGRQG